MDKSRFFKILYRVGDEDRYEWMALDGEYDPDEAYDKLNRLMLSGLEAIVCTGSEYYEIGIPETYDAEEYYTLGPFHH